MKQPQFIIYKIKREVLRVVNQMNGWRMRLYEPFVRYAHERNFYKNITVFPGLINNQFKKVALLLIYQSNKIPESVYLTCEHLIINGYHPFIVSNNAISNIDLEKLRQKTWKIIVRPNFGYDFGGYKDGIKYLQDQNVDLDNLIVMNDSIWFPLYEGDSTIQTMERAPEDFLGLLEHQRQSRTFLISLKRKPPPFLGSYFWMFKGKALQSNAFKLFWSHYKATSSKYHTVRNGEHRLTPYLAAHQLSYQGLINMDKVVSWLQQLSSEALKNALSDMTSYEPNHRQALNQILAQYTDSDAWKSRALTLVEQMTYKKNILATIQTLSINQLKVGYFKKGSDALGIHALRFFVSKVQDAKTVRKPHAAIWAEMQHKLHGKP